MAKDDLVKKETVKEKKAEPINWRNVFLTTFTLVLFVILLLLALPWIIFQFLHAKAKGKNIGTEDQHALRRLAYWRFIASAYYLNQMGYERGSLSSSQFARDVVDPRFGTSFNKFMNTFLKTKYSRQALDNYDAKVINEHYPAFYTKVKSSIPGKSRFGNWMNFYRPVMFFEKPKVK
jgi:hypothetical protein